MLRGIARANRVRCRANVIDLTFPRSWRVTVKRRAELEKLSAAPTLEAPRLRLRSHRLDDFAASAEMWVDPIVARYTGGKPLSEEEAWTKLLRYIGHWSLMGFGYWAVEDKETSRFI